MVARGDSSGQTCIVSGRIGDPAQKSVGQPVRVILPTAASLFVRRADRLDALAARHPMELWPRFMARLARAQHAAVAVTEGDSPMADDRASPGFDMLVTEAGCRRQAANPLVIAG